MSILHNQVPTARMTLADYETALCRLTEQLTAAIDRQGYSMPEGEAAKLACDKLTNTFGTADDQTIGDWINAAAREAGADPADMVGL